MITVCIALIAVVVALGGWIGVVISERARAQDADLSSIVLANQFVTDLDNYAKEWNQ